VRGIGVGLAGVVNMQSGVVHYSPFFQWRELPLADLIAAQIRLPVYVDTDVYTLTLTEHLFGAGHDIENFAVITVGRGIGMGMVLHHRLYQGGPGGAGEFGHLTLEVDGPPCDCGKRGCLEALASDPAVIRYIQQRRPSGRALPGTLLDVIAAADGGDALAREALEVSGRYIGLGLSMIVNLLCPTLIVLSGEGVIAGNTGWPRSARPCAGTPSTACWITSRSSSSPRTIAPGRAARRPRGRQIVRVAARQSGRGSRRVGRNLTFFASVFLLSEISGESG
jgi:predicted NBD/HSP70 family sugar kinase